MLQSYLGHFIVRRRSSSLAATIVPQSEQVRVLIRILIVSVVNFHQ